MSQPDLLAALLPVLDALRALGVRHFVGGSIASSAHGVARSSIDADVVAELHPEQVAGLISALVAAYYLPEDRVREAAQLRLASAGGALDRPIPLASAEDTVLAKLEWYPSGGEVSERQWGDVLGVLRVGGAALDRGYLVEGAKELGTSDLLDRALGEASAGPS